MRFPLLVIVCALSAFLIPLGFGEFEPDIVRRFCGPAKDCAALSTGEYFLQVFGTLAALALPIILVVGVVRNALQGIAAEKLGLRVGGIRWNTIDDWRCPPELARAYWSNTIITFGGAVLCLVLASAAGKDLEQQQSALRRPIPAPDTSIHCILTADGGCRVAPGNVSPPSSTTDLRQSIPLGRRG